MTARLLTSPIWEIVCEAKGCHEEPIQYVGWVESSARYAAQRAGWSVRPNSGKGSRTAPDLCPAHAPDVEAKP